MNPYHLHHPYSSLTPEGLRPLLTPRFIETGTNVGHGIACALEVGFPRVWSMDVDPALVTLARARFAHDERVTILQGQSPELLRAMMPAMTDVCTIYLDAHSIEANPLLEELDAIRLSPYRAHTILIDDVRMFGTPDWHGLRFEEALERLHTINPHYSIRYVNTPNAPNDLLVARIP